MKKIFAFLVPVFIVIALFLFINGFEGEYNFITQIKIATNRLTFDNPIDELLKIIDMIKSFNFSDSGFWSALLDVFKLVANILILPVKIVQIIIMDVASGLQFILIILGFNL